MPNWIKKKSEQADKNKLENIWPETQSFLLNCISHWNLTLQHHCLWDYEVYALSDVAMFTKPTQNLATVMFNRSTCLCGLKVFLWCSVWINLKFSLLDTSLYDIHVYTHSTYLYLGFIGKQSDIERHFREPGLCKISGFIGYKCTSGNDW